MIITIPVLYEVDQFEAGLSYIITITPISPAGRHPRSPGDQRTLETPEIRNRQSTWSNETATWVAALDVLILLPHYSLQQGWHLPFL